MRDYLFREGDEGGKGFWVSGLTLARGGGKVIKYGYFSKTKQTGQVIGGEREEGREAARLGVGG